MKRRLLAMGAALAIGLGAAWAIGFVWFVRAVGGNATLPAAADGIVVLTGGAGRVEAALKLLAEGRGRKLLVSGVGGAADFAAFAHRAGVDPSLRLRVTLGRSAVSTHGNAAETAEWVHANGLHSLIVVTAGYHMPRALAELSRALPDTSLFPAPVTPPALREPGLAALRLLAGEYCKWLAVEAGLSAIASRGEWARIEGMGGEAMDSDEMSR